MGLRFLLVLMLLVSARPAWAADIWRVTKPEWSADDEKGYSAFIQRIGDSKCETPDDCINSDANPYRGTDGRGINFNADCADLVYMLRAYYAWKNGLPFTYVTGVYARGGGDVRFSPKGTAEGAMMSQPPWSDSMCLLPSHGLLALALRPAWASWIPGTAPCCLRKRLIRANGSTWSSR